MTRCPDPILDRTEQQLTVYLSEQYRRYKQPGRFDKMVQQAHRFVPTALKESLEWAKDKEFVRRVLEHFDRWVAGRARGGIAGRYKLTPELILADFHHRQLAVDGFSAIPAMRSYEIEPVVLDSHPRYKRTAFAQGFATGVPGLPGLPFNIVFSLILYYRAVQATAMYYGFDVRDPDELAFASLVLVDSLAKDPAKYSSLDAVGPAEPGADPYEPEALINILMVGASTDNILRHLLSRVPQGTAASLSLHAAIKLHLERLFSYIGAKGVAESLENALIRRVFIVFGRRIGPILAKSAPILGGVLGGAFDTNLMQRALDGANLIYHRRFLLEKEERCRGLVQGHDLGDPSGKRLEESGTPAPQPPMGTVSTAGGGGSTGSATAHAHEENVAPEREAAPEAMESQKKSRTAGTKEDAVKPTSSTSKNDKDAAWSSQQAKENPSDEGAHPEEARPEKAPGAWSTQKAARGEDEPVQTGDPESGPDVDTSGAAGSQIADPTQTRKPADEVKLDEGKDEEEKPGTDPDKTGRSARGAAGSEIAGSKDD